MKTPTETALLEIVQAMRDYLPEGDPHEFISRVIEAVDNPDISPVIAEIEGRND